MFYPGLFSGGGAESLGRAPFLLPVLTGRRGRGPSGPSRMRGRPLLGAADRPLLRSFPRKRESSRTFRHSNAALGPRFRGDERERSRRIQKKRLRPRPRWRPLYAAGCRRGRYAGLWAWKQTGTGVAAPGRRKGNTPSPPAAALYASVASSSSSFSDSPVTIASAIGPEFWRTAASILAAMSGFSFRNDLAFSRP